MLANHGTDKMAYVGGPPDSVLKLDNMRIYKIAYEDILTGHEIWDINGQSSTNPIKQGHSTGDPHLFSFGGIGSTTNRRVG